MPDVNNDMKSTNIGGQMVYFHELMYYAFNPDRINQNLKICIKQNKDPMNLTINDVYVVQNYDFVSNNLRLGVRTRALLRSLR